MLLAGCSGMSGSDDPHTKGLPPGVHDAADLWKAYSENAVAAEKRYGGREIRVGGRVLQVRPSIVRLAGGRFDSEGVECRFDEQHNDALAVLRPGDTFTLRGKVIGFEHGGVQVDDCTPGVRTPGVRSRAP
jgi:hypothetical protein